MKRFNFRRNCERCDWFAIRKAAIANQIYSIVKSQKWKWYTSRKASRRKWINFRRNIERSKELASRKAVIFDLIILSWRNNKRNVHRDKQWEGSELTWGGTVNKVGNWQPEKQLSPMWVIQSWRVSHESEVHPEKQCEGREYTCGGTSNELSDFQLEKQPSLISWTQSWIERNDSDIHLEKQWEGIEETEVGIMIFFEGQTFMKTAFGKFRDLRVENATDQSGIVRESILDIGLGARIINLDFKDWGHLFGNDNMFDLSIMRSENSLTRCERVLLLRGSILFDILKRLMRLNLLK